MDCFIRWTKTLRTRLGEEVVALDGKALRRARNEGGSLPYVVSAWASQSALTLGQVKVDDKSNEITAIPELLRVLDLSGCIVTIDAMGCQRKIVREIVEQGAHYALSLKSNQSTMHTEVKELFASMPLDTIAAGKKDAALECDFHQTVDGDHGHVETLAALRRLALNMLKSETSKSKLSIRSKWLMAGWNGDYLRIVLGT